MGMLMGKLLVNISADCEATQPAIRDPALGERAVRGLMVIAARQAAPGTLFVIPSDLQSSGALYQEAERAGWEIGLHLHPAAQGYEEFLGLYGPQDQERILREAMALFEKVMGRSPCAFCMGYGSANDHTYPILEALGFTHGGVSIPRRVLPECASVWAGAPLGIHYPHRFNRVLAGDVDFVEIPPTVDPDSMMWGGKHPQDLRVELVDAKNHWYTMDKAIRRQLDANDPLPYLRIVTHNIFDYSDARNFRRETLQGMLQHAQSLAQKHGLELEYVTLAEINRRYRALRPRTAGAGPNVKLDRSGYGQE